MKRVLAASIAVLMLVAGGTAFAQSGGGDADGEAIISPLAISVHSTPRVVTGSDGLEHLAYELLVLNQAPGEATLETVDVVDPSDDDTIVDSYDIARLTSITRLNAGGDGTTFIGGGSGMIFLDVTFDADATVPSELAHHVSISYQPPAEAGAPAPAAQSISFTGVTTKVDTRAPVVLEPPLAGPGWIVGNGCCEPPTAHRSATLAIDGTIEVPERFAIDFVQLNDEGSLATGDGTANEDFGYFGDEIYAAAAGTVVRIQDGLPEQPPGELPANATVAQAGGNYVVVDIGRGRYTFYAHMQTGSLEVKVGDRVKAGDVLGILGNSGNTDGAHLHFHVMDGPSPLQSDGLPFEFTKFTGQGLVTTSENLAAIPTVKVPVDAGVDAGPHRKELPLDLEVVEFS